MDLTNEQWAVVETLLPEPVKRTDGKGRPRLDNRAVLNGILWVMRTGAPWHDMPDRYPSYQTCHRRFQEWVRSGTFERILRSLVQDVKERGGLDLTECFIPIHPSLRGKESQSSRGLTVWLTGSGDATQTHLHSTATSCQVHTLSGKTAVRWSRC